MHRATPRSRTAFDIAPADITVRAGIISLVALILGVCAGLTAGALVVDTMGTALACVARVASGGATALTAAAALNGAQVTGDARAGRDRPSDPHKTSPPQRGPNLVDQRHHPLLCGAGSTAPSVLRLIPRHRRVASHLNAFQCLFAVVR